ncbi:toxin HicA [Herbiconiux sp.]|uniref:toxin HicA n=1 Tax=Herbiconiux sp. TaxID=1871186 RepID=UPI0025C03D7C|nr:toxin HicA [Herbiconiux sp.]
MRQDRTSVSFADLAKVCVHYFGEPRQRGTSHMVFRMPWPGDPRVNIQNVRGMAKPYQVKQVLAAIDRWEGENG